MRGRVAAGNSIPVGASTRSVGKFESSATAALFGRVGSVVLGAASTMLVAEVVYEGQVNHMVLGSAM